MASSSLDPPRDAASDPVTLRDLLAVTDLGLTLATGGDLLDRAVRWAHSTELLDPRPYLQGAELVLTVGSALTHDEACQRFVTNLVAAHASALGFGVGDVVDAVPAALLAACRTEGLPLLVVPPGVPFLRITELLAEHRAEARAARGRRTQHLVAQLLDKLGPDSSPGDLVVTAAAGLGGGVALLGDDGAVIAASHHPPGRVVVGVDVDDAGRLVWWPLTEADAPPDTDALSQVGHVLGLHRRERDVERAQARAELGRLLRLVVDGRADPEVLADLLSPAGVAATQITPLAWPLAAAPMVSRRLPGTVTAAYGEAALTLANDLAVAVALADEAALPCGVGETVDLAGLRHAVPEAIAALELSRRRGSTARSDDLTSFDGLLEQQPAERLAPFSLQLIAPLADHDAQHGTQLLATLRAFLEGDGAVNATARGLYLHPNSLRHRLGRIQDLTGRNPLVFADRIALAVGLWAWDRRGLRESQPRPRRA